MYRSSGTYPLSAAPWLQFFSNLPTSAYLRAVTFHSKNGRTDLGFASGPAFKCQSVYERQMLTSGSPALICFLTNSETGG